MAEEEVKENVEEVDAAPEANAQKGGDKTKTMVVFLIVLSLFVMICTPVISIFAIKAFSPSNKENQDEILNNTSTEITFKDPFQVTIAETQGTRYAKVTVVLEVSDGSMRKFFELKTDQTPQGMLNMIRHEINMIISSKTLEGLDSVTAKTKLANEIRNKLNEMLQKKTDGIVKEVIFPEFLIN